MDESDLDVGSDLETGSDEEAGANLGGEEEVSAWLKMETAVVVKKTRKIKSRKKR